MTKEELESLLKDLDEQIDKNRTAYLEKNDYLHDLKRSHEVNFVEENVKFKSEMTFDDDSGTWEIEEAYYDSDNGGICYSCWLSDTFNGCKIFTESEIENLINKPVVKISLEDLKQKKKEISIKIEEAEKICVGICDELRQERNKLVQEYTEQNKLYQNGFKFIDKHGDSREIAYAFMYGDVDEIFYMLSGFGHDEEVLSEIQITNFLNNNAQ